MTPETSDELIVLPLRSFSMSLRTALVTLNWEKIVVYQCQGSIARIKVQFSHLLVEFSEQIIAPCHQRKLIDLVDIFAALFDLTTHPVSVEIGANAVEHLWRELILFPFLRVERQHIFAHQVLAFLLEQLEIFLQEVFQSFVELETDELSAASGWLLLSALTAASNCFRCATWAANWLLMDAGAVVVDMTDGYDRQAGTKEKESVRMRTRDW